MKFDLDLPRDAERLASLVSSLQREHVKFELERETVGDGHFSRYVALIICKH